VPELPSIAGFRVLEEIGLGSVSSVFKAVEEPLGRTVALKVLKGTIAPTSPFALQLEREARMLSELCHPNIGLLFRFSKDDKAMMLVLEYIDGWSLAALLKKVPTLPPEGVTAVGAAVARGLAYSHRRGVVHRDIKPGNIMVSRVGEAKIFDFGIAQRSSDEPEDRAPVRLESAAAFGTPAYMSPEQILGEGVDGRSDIFSLGVVLYQLASGARPFERADEADRRPAAHRIRRDPPIPLHRRAPGVPVALERIIMRAIEKLPDDRFQSAESLAEHLEDFAGSRWGLRADQLLVRALEQAGLVVPGDRADAAAPPRDPRAPVRQALAGLAGLGTIAVAGGIVLAATAHRDGQSGGAAPLELVPPAPGFLRVLATPWAEVWIDGQRVEVTPVAHATPLVPGTHFVTLVHPNAPVEKRSVVIVQGETKTLDVAMAVPGGGVDGDAETARPSAERER
jgi:eukaryotic-like serine/threonine-protein kinase